MSLDIHTTSIENDAVSDTPREPNPTDDASYLQYVPRVEATIRTQGLLRIPRSVIERQAMLGIPNANGESFLGHSEAVGEMTSELMEGLDRWSETRRISSGTGDLIRTAANIHDVGKTGPSANVNPNPIPFVKFYNVNFPFGTQQALLRTALDYAVKIGKMTEADKEYIKEVLRKKGYDPDRIYLRTFYNLHSLDTYDVLKEAGVDETLAAAASGHHLKRGVKPDGYSFRELAETGRYIEPMDEWAAMTRTGNLKKGLSTRERLQAVYIPFTTMRNSVGRIYCDTIQAAVASEVLPKILEKHQHQNL